MPALLIDLVNGNWQAQIANTDDIAFFAGNTPAEQALSVAQLSEAMQVGEETLVQVILDIFPLTLPEGATAADVVFTLFGSTTELWCQGINIYSVADGVGSLLEVLGDAGVNLAEWLLL